MKKKYVKPELLYEQYMLNQHMAADCAMMLNSGTEYECRADGSPGTEFSGMVLFRELAICGMDMQSAESVERTCYFVSTNSVETLGLHGSGG